VGAQRRASLQIARHHPDEMAQTEVAANDPVQTNRAAGWRRSDANAMTKQQSSKRQLRDCSKGRKRGAR